MRPLERRQTVERERRSEASSIAADTVVGLRVLRGLGGEEEFAGRYVGGIPAASAARRSARRSPSRSLTPSRSSSPARSSWRSPIWARGWSSRGAYLPGHLVAYYAYAAFLLLPIQTLMEAATRWSAATVAAGRVLSVLRRDPDLPSPESEYLEAPTGPISDSKHRA